jgi:hypothetical protein
MEIRIVFSVLASIPVISRLADVAATSLEEEPSSPQPTLSTEMFKHRVDSGGTEGFEIPHSFSRWSAEHREIDFVQ